MKTEPLVSQSGAPRAASAGSLGPPPPRRGPLHLRSRSRSRRRSRRPKGDSRKNLQEPKLKPHKRSSCRASRLRSFSRENRASSCRMRRLPRGSSPRTALPSTTSHRGPRSRSSPPRCRPRGPSPAPSQLSPTLRRSDAKRRGHSPHESRYCGVPRRRPLEPLPHLWHREQRRCTQRRSGSRSSNPMRRGRRATERCDVTHGDWEALTDDTGRTFYHHISSGHTQWEPPDKEVSAALRDVQTTSEDWEVCKDDRGFTFYHHLASGHTQWELPEALGWHRNTKRHIDQSRAGSGGLQWSAPAQKGC